MVERGLAESREQAKRLVMAGLVSVAGRQNLKPGQVIAADETVLLAAGEKYVSRGGLKLEAALDRFGIDPAGRVCADVGASTGGFTDCLLQRGARLVWALDVGHSQLHPRIRGHQQVRVLEHTNARHLRPETMAAAPPSLLVADLSFISLKLVLPVFAVLVPAGAEILIALIKPQFEATRQEVARCQGVIKDSAVRRRVLAEVIAAAREANWHLAGLGASPIRGGSGNVEFIARFDAAPPAAAPPQQHAAIELSIDAALAEQP